jgi:hypothetical protein
MSLRTFHMVFIGVSVVLAAFVAAWAVQQYLSSHALGYVMTAAAAVVSGCGLIVYGTRFQRKTKAL